MTSECITRCRLGRRADGTYYHKQYDQRFARNVKWPLDENTWLIYAFYVNVASTINFLTFEFINGDVYKCNDDPPESTFDESNRLAAECLDPDNYIIKVIKLSDGGLIVAMTFCPHYEDGQLDAEVSEILSRKKGSVLMDPFSLDRVKVEQGWYPRRSRRGLQHPVEESVEC